MEAPTSRNHHAVSHEPPSIFVDKYRSPPDFYSPTRRILPPISSAMSIPGARDHDVPPPLPPPRYVQGNPMDLGRRNPPSNYGSLDEEKPNYQTRPERDEGYSSFSSFGSGRSALKFGMSHDHYSPQFNHDYDISLKRKLDSAKTVENRSPPRISSLVSAVSGGLSSQGATSKFVPLSLPIHTARTGLSEHMPTSTASPGTAPYYSVDYRSPSDNADSDRSPYTSRRTNSGSVTDEMASTQGSVADEVDFPIEETSGMRRLKLEDSIVRQTGIKRRASSPPDDEPHIHPIGSEHYRRRDPPSRGSPTPRLPIPPVSRAGSYSSALSAVSTTMAPFTRLSPVGLSPGGTSPMGPDPSMSSPYPNLLSSACGPRPPILRTAHQRNASESRPLVSSRKHNGGKSSTSRLHGFYMCDCCPKKPKKFDTKEELAAHEAEKQYGCSFCGNRFKNKNEAERHQNSLHVRRHSWSCSALSNYDRAFHDSTAHPGEADTCGYCGEEFERSGGTGRIKQATDQDWDNRIRHLQEVHKFRECNSAKKFYRADHFRQHLKHSHAGASGKWTNMLENACMTEEEPPR